MATKSAGKANRRSLARKARNRAVRTFTRTRVKQGIEVVTSGDQQAATEAVRLAVAALDRAARKGVYHQNKAARQKSRLMRRLNTVAVAAPKAKAPAKRSRTRKT